MALLFTLLSLLPAWGWGLIILVICMAFLIRK